MRGVVGNTILRPRVSRRNGESEPHVVAACGATLITLPIYLLTMNRTIGFIDRGELAAVAATWGVAHPTGYPVLTALGWTMTRIVPLRPVLALNLLAAVLVAIGVGLTTLVFARVLVACSDARWSSGARAFCAAVAAVTCGLSATWWQQANGFEAYALHAVMMPLVVLMFLRWMTAVECETRRNHRGDAGRWFALVLGLSFANHMTTVLLAPGLIAYAIVRAGGGRGLLRLCPDLVLPFLAGLLPYFLLPLISAQGPRFDWGGTHSIHGLINHLTAREFRGWMFSDPAAFAKQLRFVGFRLPWDFAWWGGGVAAAGGVLLARRARPMAALVGGVILATLVYACGYRIRDLDAYLLGCVFGLGACLACGLLWVGERVGPRVALALGVALAVTGGGMHYGDCDESGNRLVEVLARQQLGELPPGAVLITGQWDYALSASYYFQAVEHFRPDVVVVSQDLARSSWYVDELERRAPGLIAGCRREADVYRSQLVPFERGAPYNSREIAVAYRAFTSALIDAAHSRGTVRVTSDALGLVQGKWRLAPVGLALELRSDTSYVPDPRPEIAFSPWRGRVDAYVATTSWIYASALLRRAAYERSHGFPAAEAECTRQALRFDPQIRLDRLPPQPLDGDELVAQSVRLFSELRRGVPAH